MTGIFEEIDETIRRDKRGERFVGKAEFTHLSKAIAMRLATAGDEFLDLIYRVQEASKRVARA